MQHMKIVLLLGGLFSSFLDWQRYPYKAYENKDHPMADTAVFSALVAEQDLGYTEAGVSKLDGTDIPCVSKGCPHLIRVIPGNHVIQVRHTSNPRLFGGNIKLKVQELGVNLDMKAGHIYAAKYTLSPEGTQIQIEDLGFHPKYGVTMSAGNPKYFPVEF